MTVCVSFHTSLHSTPPLGGRRRNIAITFDIKTRMLLLPDGEKSLMMIVISTQRGGRTDICDSSSTVRASHNIIV